MASITSRAIPLVSVIIPCYNHEKYLQEAIDSVLRQSHPAIEIIVVDDGSTDNSKAVAQQNPGVKYFFQSNQGPSAARNKGILHSKGDFLVFLDADDYFYKDGIAINLNYLHQYDQLAFVSGSHDKVLAESDWVHPDVKTITSDHYSQLLKINYIGMHATVMYRRWVFDEFLFDASLRGCEEYDLFLRVARKYPVLHHANRIAAYRLHKANTSKNISLMLTTALKVLKRQKKYLSNSAEVRAYHEGLNIWKTYYTQEMALKLQQENRLTLYDYYIFLMHDPSLTFSHIANSTSTNTIMNHLIKRIPYGRIRKRIKSFLLKNDPPPPGKVNLGHLQRNAPFSTQFGYDRGGPVDRYYIEKFLGMEALSIKGRVLEIGDNTYTMQYGGDNVTKSDILHVNDSNPNATLIGDISNAPNLPDNTFDCIILTQTLHLIYNFKEALQTCHRILKPGGTLLLTVPGITPIDHGEWKDTWYWSFTDKSMKKLMWETFPGGTQDVKAYGNVFTATAFLYGMGLPEVPFDKLLYNDTHYQVTVTVKATKALQK